MIKRKSEMNTVTKSIKNDELISFGKACKENGISLNFIKFGIASDSLHCKQVKKNGRVYRQLNPKQVETFRANYEDKFVDLTSEAGIGTYMNYLAQKSSAMITTNPTRGYTFRDVEIEGVRFQGYVGYSGPCIKRLMPQRHPWGGGSAPLGRVIEIHYIDKFPSHISYCPDKQPGWYICKYGPGEPLINISSLSEAGLHTLAFQFGIPIYPNDKAKPKVTVPVEWTYFRIFRLPNGDIPFFMSPSFNDLCTWAKNHPRQIRSSQFRDDYLRGWKKAAANGEFHPGWQGWKGPAIKAKS
jgi:hypothetical protein